MSHNALFNAAEEARIKTTTKIYFKVTVQISWVQTTIYELQCDLRNIVSAILKTRSQAILRVGSIAFLLHPDVYEADGDRILLTQGILTLATQLNTRRNIPVLAAALGFSSRLSSEHF